MAKFSVDPKDFDIVLKELDRSADVDSWGPKALEEASVILEQNIKRRASTHDRTGAMSGSIKPTKPKKNRWGHFIVIRPTGKDKKGVRNMEKLVYMEYGTSKQSPTPVITPALNDVADEVNAKIQEVFEREVMK